MIVQDKGFNIYNKNSKNLSYSKTKKVKPSNIFVTEPDKDDKISTAKTVACAVATTALALLIADAIFFQGKHIKRAFNFVKNSFNFSSKQPVIEEYPNFVLEAHRSAHPLNISGNLDCDLAKKIDQQIRSLPPIGKNISAYRGVTQNYFFNNKEFESLMNAKCGDIITPHKGFSFFAFNKDIANHFADSVDTGRILLEVNIPAEAKLSMAKRELVSPLGTTYKILKKSQNKNGLVKILADYIV